MAGNIFLPRQPEKSAFRVALVIPQCLRGETSRDLVEVSEFLADRAVARRDQLERLGLGDLAKRRRPVSLGLLGKIRRRGNNPDRLGEGGFDQDLALGHWDRYQEAQDGWGWMQVYHKSFWEYVNVLSGPCTSEKRPNLR